MPQMHFSVNAETARELEERAKEKGQSLSRYLAELVKSRSRAWPPGYIERVVGSCANEPLVEPADLPLDDISL